MRRKQALRMAAAAIAAAAALLPCAEAKASPHRLQGTGKTTGIAGIEACSDMKETWRLAKKAFRENEQLASAAKAAQDALMSILKEAMSCQKEKPHEEKTSKEAEGNNYKCEKDIPVTETAAEITYTQEAFSANVKAEPTSPAAEDDEAAEEDEAVSAIVSSGMPEGVARSHEGQDITGETADRPVTTSEKPHDEPECRKDKGYGKSSETLPEPSCEDVRHVEESRADTATHDGEGETEKSHDDHNDVLPEEQQAEETGSGEEPEDYGDEPESGQYGQAGEPDEEAQIEHSEDVSCGRSLADITYLDDGEMKPAMIFVHGGSWTGGDKSSFSQFAEDFAKEGYAVISVNYQLYDWKKMNLSEMRNEVEEAIKWASSGEAMEYQADPERIFVTGFSAGAHLAACALKNLAYEGDTALESVSGAVLCGTPADIKGTMPYLLLAMPETASSRLDPSRRVPSGLPSVLLLHGDADTMVPIQGARNFHEKLKASGCDSTLYVSQGTGHALDMGAFFGTWIEWMGQH